MISEDQWINLPVGYNLEDHTNVSTPIPTVSAPLSARNTN